MVQCLSIHPSVCLSQLSTAAAACGGFAAVGLADRRYRSIAARLALSCSGAAPWQYGSQQQRLNTELTRHQLYCIGRLPAVLQFPALSKRDSSASLGMWHVRTLNRITIGSLGHRSDRPVIGGDLLGALVPAGWGRLILMYSLSASGSTQPGERPVTTHSGDVSSTL